MYRPIQKTREWKGTKRLDKIYIIRTAVINFHSTCIWGLCIICINYIHVKNRWKRKSWLAFFNESL